MFRFMRPRKSILSLSRLPLSVEAQAYRGQATNVQRVHFRKPAARIRAKNVAISVLTFWLCYSVYSKLVLDPLDRAAEEALAHIPDDEELDEKPLFIPFPGTTKQLQAQPYRGSDPEWQEFVKFSKDQPQANKVRTELAGYVKGVAEKHPVLSLRCGKVMKVRKFWLDIDFPQHAPPEFVRSGIEIADDHIVWTQAPVDSLTVFRLRQAFWPSALVTSFWSFTKVMVVDDIKRFAGMLGIQQTPPPPLAQIIARHQQLIKSPLAKDGPPTQPQTVRDPTKVVTDITAPEKTAIIGKGPAEPEDNKESQLPGTSHLIRAMWAFRMKLAQTWRPAPNFPPRGSILVSGFVELDSPKAWLVFDVKAAWDPKAKTFDARSMNLSLRRMQLKKQGPAAASR